MRAWLDADLGQQRGGLFAPARRLILDDVQGGRRRTAVTVA
jgi:hypothetical protein